MLLNLNRLSAIALHDKTKETFEYSFPTYILFSTIFSAL